MKQSIALAGVVVGAVAVLASSSVFTINEARQALVLQFGELVRPIHEPGLHFKIPFIQNVVIVDRRVLDLDPPVEQVILADQKRLDVDAFARYRIVDPFKFYQSVQTEAAAVARMNAVVNSALRRVLGNETILAVLSKERSRIMAELKQQVNGEAKRFGIEIVDVRIRRADLPEETSQAIFARMRSERVREAAEARAQGQEQSQQIKARAERERTVILAEAQREAQVQRGIGDNQALKLIAESTTADPAFYAYYRTLEAYRSAMSSSDTTMVLAPKGEFFRYFGEGPAALRADGVKAPVPALPAIPLPAPAPAK